METGRKSNKRKTLKNTSFLGNDLKNIRLRGLKKTVWWEDRKCVPKLITPFFFCTETNCGLSIPLPLKEKKCIKNETKYAAICYINISTGCLKKRFKTTVRMFLHIKPVILFTLKPSQIYIEFTQSWKLDICSGIRTLVLDIFVCSQ